MTENEWQMVAVRRSMYEEAEQIAPKRHFPNVTQYINDALRRALDKDAEKVREASHE